MTRNPGSGAKAARPRVSVVIPAYNRIDMLRRAVRSALAQTYMPLEVLVVDDGSERDVATETANLRDPRLKVVRHPVNRGASAARNTGIGQAVGEYIAFLDSDDQWEPACVERRLACFEGAGPETVMVYAGVRVVPPIKPPRDQYLHGDLSQALLVRNVIGSTSCIMVRKTALQAIGGFDETLPSCQDWDLYIRLAKLGRIEAVRELLVLYHTHANSITGSTTAAIVGHRRLRDKHAAAIAALPPALRARHELMLTNLFLRKLAWRDAAGSLLRATRADPHILAPALKQLLVRKLARRLRPARWASLPRRPGDA